MQFTGDASAYGFDLASELAGEPDRASQILYGDRLLDATDSHGFGQRIRWSLQCQSCRRTVPVRDDRLQDILTRLAKAQQPVLTLRRLSDILQPRKSL